MSTEHKKRLTQQQKENIKKYVIFSLMFMAFAGIMYYLFTPKTKENATDKNSNGMNVSIPEASNTNLLGDKKTAYEKQLLEKEQKQKQQAIANLSEMFANNDTIVNRNAYKQTNVGTNNSNSIRSSVSAYKDIHNTLDNFYVEDNSETEALKEELTELKKQLAEQNNTENSIDRQMEMMEKSYQMASKYLPINNPNGQQEQTSQITQTKKRLDVKPVKQYRPSVVSSLQGTFSDNAFSTAVGYVKDVTKNTIKVCIHRTTSIRQGESLPLRLLEDVIVGDTHIPAQTVLIAMPQIRGNRMLLTISTVQYQGTLLPVDLSAYDLDGQEGLFVPGTLEQNAVKEVLSGIGKASGSANTFSMNSSASQQLLTDVGKGVIQGASNYLSNKIQDIKIKVKAGHSLLLYSKKENQ